MVCGVVLVLVSLEERSLTFERSLYDFPCSGKPKIGNRLLRRSFRTKTEAAPAGLSKLRRDGCHSCPLNIISDDQMRGAGNTHTKQETCTEL
jgi:hypothetical protein